MILRSNDDGATWKQLAVGGAPDLDFRGIAAFDATTAFVMSSGNGDKSRIYKTQDGGSVWALQYSGTSPAVFLDSIVCESATSCLALSDPVDGKFVVLSTTDGSHWKDLPRDKMPATLPNEGAFAASGSSIAVCDGGENIYFGTGGASSARVFRSRDHGLSWTVANTPMASGNASSGIFSIACGEKILVAVGGDYKEGDKSDGVSAYSNDLGTTWHLAEKQPRGYRSSVARIAEGVFLAVGPNGADIGRSNTSKTLRWEAAGDVNFNALASDDGKAWAVGPEGTIASFTPR